MNRRSFLRGLFAAPAIVAIDSLMPVRGIIAPWAPEGIMDWNTEHVELGLGITIDGRISLTQIRDLLLPGLWNISGKYPDPPGKWLELFETSDV